jgi:hypothetical protein
MYSLIYVFGLSLFGDQATSQAIREPGFDYLLGAGGFLFSKSSRLNMEHTQPPSQNLPFSVPCK